MVATDHCAFTTQQKEFGLGDFTKIPNGTGGLEDRMPVLWTYGVGTGRLTESEFVAVTSTNIARILNIYPRKGAILAGSDADIFVWDPKLEDHRLRHQQSIIDYNVFEGSRSTDCRASRFRAAGRMFPRERSRPTTAGANSSRRAVPGRSPGAREVPSIH